MASLHSPNEALKHLMEQIEERKKAVAELEDQLSERLANPLPEPKLPAAHWLDTPETRDRQLKIGEEVARVVADINFLKASPGPEGYPEGNSEETDDNIKFYLAVGELQKHNETLRSHLEVSQSNLASIDADVKVTEELIEQYQEFLAATKEYVKRRKEPTESAQSSVTSKTEEMDQKIRATNVVYKKIKSYLADLLNRMSPAAEGQEDSSMARFLQELWNAFQGSPTQWVDLSGLDFDIEDEVVHQLVRAGIIENHPEEPSKIRLIDFTE